MIGYIKILASVPLLSLAFLATTGIHAFADKGIGSPKGKQCKKQLDFSIVVDESASISDDQWEGQMIPFLRNLIHTVDLDNTDIRLSLTTYSTPTRQIFTFLDAAASSTRLALTKLDWMNGTKARYGMTYTGRALNYVRKAILPYGRKNVPKALLLITDGVSSDGSYTAQVAAMLRDEGVNVMVIGVGDVNVAECRGIVGCDGIMDCPMFKQTNWKDIMGLFNSLMKEVCDILPQDAVCEPVWAEWSSCNGECGVPGKRTRALLDLRMIEKPVNGSNGQPGKSCEDQKMNFLPQSETCTIECNHEPVPSSPEPVSDDMDHPEPTPVTPEGDMDKSHSHSSIPSTPDMPSSHSDMSSSPTDMSSSPTDMSSSPTDMSSSHSDMPSTPTGMSSSHSDMPSSHSDMPSSHSDMSSSPTDMSSSHADTRVGNTDEEHNHRKDMDVKFPENMDDIPVEDNPIPTDPRHGVEPSPSDVIPEDDQLRRTLEMQREEDLKKELMLQHELKLQEEKERAAILENNTPYGSATSVSQDGESPTGVPQSSETDAIRHEVYDDHPEESENTGINADVTESEDYEGEKQKDESNERSTSNTTKIAGGALLGLLLLGAGGGYAMYKKNKTPTVETGSGDYTGADESSEPMKEGDTYTVTEFDNNIWGEAA
uniref:Thrombospondin-related anonymous protein n=1 Tax=Babesia bovis TaxID=5865 RepID=Q6JH13_BABBO|nr:thrombospondin-related anonymous protein [Babesia bovis]